MLYNGFIELCLFTATLGTGFYAGTGFFTLMGGNPSIRRMSDKSFAEYWQQVDHFIAARMKVFGPVLLTCLLTTVLALLKECPASSFWCMVLALGILIADIVFTLSRNHPLNKMVQSWDLNHLPYNVTEIKWQIAKAFTTRSFFMIASFIMVLAAVWLRQSAP